MTRAGFTAVALAALSVCAPVPVAAQICTAGMALDDCLNSIYHANTWAISPKRTLRDWSVAVAAAKWKPGSDCANVKAAAQDAFKRSHHFAPITRLANPSLYFVDGPFRDTVTAGIHWPIGTNIGWVHIFGYDSTMTEAGYWETTLHEAAHHGGYSDVGSFNAYTAETCATRDEQKEKQLKAGGGGGGYWYYQPAVYKWVCEDQCVSSPDPPGIDCGAISVTVTNCHLEKVKDGEWVWVET